MDSSLTDSEDDQTFLLIRLPKETVERSRNRAADSSTKVGSVFVFEDGSAEFQDDSSLKTYTLMRNSPKQPKPKNEGDRSNISQKKVPSIISNEESDLFKISLQNDEAVHLGKVRLATLLSVSKVDETDVSTVSL